MGTALHSEESVNAIVFSPCNTYLICGTGLGNIHVWRFATEASDGSVEPPQRCVSLCAHGCAVYALTFTHAAAGTLLLSAADEEICAWRWDDILGHRPAGVAPTPQLRLENARTMLRRGALGQLSETSALAIDTGAQRLYSAAGDGNAYAWDLATQQCVATFPGVGEPLHCLALCERRQQLVTGGEDGGVRLWDVRAAAAPRKIRRAGEST